MASENLPHFFLNIAPLNLDEDGQAQSPRNDESAEYPDFIVESPILQLAPPPKKNEQNSKETNSNLNYNAFVNSLINNPSTTGKDRERIVELLLKERDKGYVTEEQVMDMIRKYLPAKAEDKTTNEPQNTESALSNINYKSPKKNQDFLFAYNQDEILKYTCHNIDDEDVINDIVEKCGTKEYEFEKHLDEIHKHFSNLRQGKYVDYKMLNLISVYLTGKTIKGEASEWSLLLKVSDNWASDKLKEWAKKNPNVVPNPGENISATIHNSGYKLPKPYLSPLTGERILYFSDLVLYFKSLFHIKADNSLKSILSHVNETQKYQEHNIIIVFDEQFIERTELFVNVEAVVQAYMKIIKICSNYSEKQHFENTQIKLSFYEDSDKRKCLCIHHMNTKYGKTKNDAITRVGEEQTRLIEKNINGVCDLYIQAVFEDNLSYEINLWDGKRIDYKNIEDIHDGVKYIMKF